ncbi:hypothetical protein EDB85DRAFT_1894546 [Lactarius pseudohatsudake]|nr:hypothetical protein EDB85DRAFT_1894546 [Lactarius pseudohatsudake]
MFGCRTCPHKHAVCFESRSAPGLWYPVRGVEAQKIGIGIRYTLWFLNFAESRSWNIQYRNFLIHANIRSFFPAISQWGTVFWTDFYDVNHIRRSSLTGVVALRRKQPARFQTRDTSVADNESQYSPRDQVLTSTWGQSTSMRQIEPGEGSEKRGKGCSRSFGVTDAKAPCSQGVQISVFRFLGAASPAALRDDGEGDAVPCTENMKFVRSDIPDDQKTTGVIV